MYGMTHFPAQPGAPIACDMTGALDTPDERLAEYRRLFASARISSERSDNAVVMRFRADAHDDVDDLARREAACCPFLDYRVEISKDVVVWTITGEPGWALDLYHELPHSLPGTFAGTADPEAAPSYRSPA